MGYTPYLSKSKFMNGLQCEKLLWYHYNRKEDIPKPDANKQELFDQGHEVGEYAKQLFSKGVDVEWDAGFKEVLETSKKKLEERKPLFEAGFVNGNSYSRIDVLNPAGKDEWDIIEVKSSTKLKEEHIDDIAYQKYCCIGAGLKVKKCFLLSINSDYIRKGDTDVKQLFVQLDVTKEVNERFESIEKEVKSFNEIIAKKSCPSIDIGQQCNKPYECDLKHICWAFLGKNNVTELYRIGKKAFSLIDDGIHKIKDIPKGYNLNENQQIQKLSAVKNMVYVDAHSIKKFIESIEYPVYYFDFETISGAIPVFDDVQPYQQVPFQFSLHVQNEPGGEVKHYEYLADSKKDFREELVKEMKKVIGDDGDIMAYHMSFEKKRIEELAELFPDYSDWLNSLLHRFVDLIIPFRNFSYYNPKQQGKAGLKAVLPAITDKSYEGMKISEGGEASREFMRITFKEKVSQEEKQKARKNLLKYCEQDTKAMIWIKDELERII